MRRLFRISQKQISRTLAVKVSVGVYVLTFLAVVAAMHLESRPAIAQGAAVAYEGAKVMPSEFNGDVRVPAPLRPDQAVQQPYRRILPAPPSMKPRIEPGPRAEQPQAADNPVSQQAIPSPTQNFAGLSKTQLCGAVPCGAGWPPDPNGDVGLKYYIEAVNSAYAIYSKTGTLLASFTENQLWSGSGSTPCNGNGSGDPVVLYDHLADRWILTHFAFAFNVSGDPVSPFYQCIAASKGGDPLAGGWWLYAVRMDSGGAGEPPVGMLNDYAKFGIWTDCLYMAANEFQEPAEKFIGTSFASFSRSDLYRGAPLTYALGFINDLTDPFTMIPSNLSGKAAPPAGTPNYFVSESNMGYAFEVRKFTAGPNCGGGGTLSAPTNISHLTYVIPVGAFVPQPGTTNKLDPLSERLMQKVQYRKVGAAESLWLVHNVLSTATPSVVTSHWAQINVTGGVISTTPVQEQIYAPDTTNHRWMGSLAVDSQGNMALGYSISNPTVIFPSIWYSGRLATDPLNTLPQSENILINGSGSQTNNCGGAPCHRWGDYTALSVDPADDCTFWYVNEYYDSPANGSSGNWQTRIGSFKFPSCPGSPPPNDNLAAATVIGSARFWSSGDTEFFTSEAADPVPSCGNASQARSAWYKFTPSVTGTITVDTFDSNYDTILSAYTRPAGSLTPVSGGCSDDAGDGRQSQISFQGTAGTTYYFMISASFGDGGALVLHFSAQAPNDNFAMATMISTPSSTSIDTTGATTEGTDPTPGCGNGSLAKSVWYRFAPSVSGTITADTFGSGYDTILSAYTGNVGAFTQIACNDDSGGVIQSRISFQATAMTTYFFMVSAWNGDGDALTFHLNVTLKKTEGQITSQ